MGHSLFPATRLKKDTRRRYPVPAQGWFESLPGKRQGNGLLNRTQGIVMKKFLLATTALVVLAATSAGAADMYARPAYTPPPPPLPVYSWTGLYFGGNVGYSWGQSKSDRTGSLVGLGVNVRESQEVDGAIGGVQTGYNYQFGTWVFGLETDIQASGQKGGSTFSSLGTSS